jgi:D-alanyl-D-alanine carboxypeptidase
MQLKLPSLMKWVTLLTILAVNTALSAPYAAIIIDAESGAVLHEENADTRLHPAGLTKLITLYAAFDAIETGLIGLDDKVRISLKAAHEPPVKLGLRDGQRIKVRYLLRAAGVQGANDAATALAEGIDGSESAFARRMNGYSKELGMTRSSWKNAHGLTEKGHLSTARDIATLFAAHVREFPDYFNLFSRIRTHAGLREVANSSRRVLGSMKGIKGAKYGYTRAAGFSSAVYVERRGKKVIGVIFGERSTARLYKRMGMLIDQAFENTM